MFAKVLLSLLLAGASAGPALEFDDNAGSACTFSYDGNQLHSTCTMGAGFAIGSSPISATPAQGTELEFTWGGTSCGIFFDSAGLTTSCFLGSGFTSGSPASLTGSGASLVFDNDDTAGNKCEFHYDGSVLDTNCPLGNGWPKEPAIGILGTSCPNEGTHKSATAGTHGCPYTVSAKMGGYSQNKCNGGVIGPSVAISSQHKYLRVGMVCRQGGCNARLYNAEVRMSTNVPCKGFCGSGTAQCSSSFPSPGGGALRMSAPVAYTTYGPIPAGTSFYAYGKACNGYCSDNYISDAWMYYQTAQCFEDAHCPSGKTCSSATNTCA